MCHFGSRKLLNRSGVLFSHFQQSAEQKLNFKMNRVLATVPRLAEQCVKQAVAAPCRRALGTSQVRLDAGPERVDISKLKEAQKHFQIDDGTPVYLKGGLADQILFGTTVALCIFGLGYGATVIYDLAMPPQN